MRLFKYTTREAAIKILRSGTLQFSVYDALNDPFEFAFHDPPRLGGGEAVHYREPLASGLVLCSFSAITPYKDVALLPWSHYGEGHRGIVLGFDSKVFTDKLFKPSALKKLSRSKIFPGVFYKVKYRKKLICLKDYQPFQFDKSPLLTKSEAWKYEQEYRLFGQVKSEWRYRINKDIYNKLGQKYIDRSERFLKDGKILFPFPPKALEVIYFGCQQDINSQKDREIIHRLIKKYPNCNYDYLKSSNSHYRFDMAV